jgi:hypothetical protein
MKSDYSFLSPKGKNNRTSSQQAMILRQAQDSTAVGQIINTSIKELFF